MINLENKNITEELLVNQQCLTIVETKDKRNHYVISEGIAKALIIDGLTVLEFLAIPYVVPVVLGVAGLPPVVISSLIPTLSSEVILGELKMTALVSSYKFIFRGGARDLGGEYSGGILAGSTAYAMKMNNPLAGAINNLGYEACNNNKQCSDNIALNFGIAMTLEAIDTIILQSNRNNPIEEKVGVGALLGFLGAFNANYIYGPLVPYVHSAADYLSGFNVLSGEGFLDSVY
jgi:hypothetical protein